MAEDSDLISVLESYFKEVMEKGVSVEIIKWELDNYIYPYIGSKIAEGVLSKEQAIELIKFCEEKLKELQKK